MQILHAEELSRGWVLNVSQAAIRKKIALYEHNSCKRILSWRIRKFWSLRIGRNACVLLADDGCTSCCDPTAVFHNTLGAAQSNPVMRNRDSQFLHAICQNSRS